jgi:hypothetical protein
LFPEMTLLAETLVTLTLFFPEKNLVN